MIGSGACVNWAGDLIYDLNDFDNYGRDRTAHEAATITGGNNKFSYKACQPPYSFTDHDTGALGTAYWSYSGTQTYSGTQKYSFMNADIESLPANDDGIKTEGWTITWSSHEACDTDGSKKFVMVLTGTCVEDGTDSMSSL